MVPIGDVIVINLKRHIYKDAPLKDNTIIAIPLQITIDYCHYELIAFVLHCCSKTANTGHYKAYVNCDAEWCEFDDDKVRTVNSIELAKLSS